MERRRLLLKFAGRLVLAAALVAFAVIAIPSPAAAAAAAEKPDCTPRGIAAGKCPEAKAIVHDGTVTIGATDSRPGRGNAGGGGAVPVRDPRLDGFPSSSVLVEGLHDAYVFTPAVKISDLVSFRPVAGVDHMEPEGWVIVGLDANFYATASSEVQSGVLLGQQAQVRFTPVRFRWSYGDGQSATRSTAGARWKALGVREFDPTPTSHVFEQRGEYDIDLTIDFAAEYRYAGGEWASVQGVLPVPANRLHVTAGKAKTVLVEQNCLQRPTGPGC